MTFFRFRETNSLSDRSNTCFEVVVLDFNKPHLVVSAFFMPQQCCTGASLSCKACIILCPSLVTVPLTYWEGLGAAFQMLRLNYHYFWAQGIELPDEISQDEDPFLCL